MKRKRKLILAALLLLMGLAVLGYPMLSNYVNEINGSRAIQELNAQLDRTGQETLNRERTAAEDYNRRLSGLPPGGKMPAEYEQILDFGNGIMGYLQIPKIGVNLPIYHGVSEAVLSRGVGHLPQSALPIGGAGNHSVLSGHTGLPTAELFNDLTELEQGDLFCISILGETLAYGVEEIQVVLPEDVDSIIAVPGEDYCTLVTCTPYGINSHRLLVRGSRVEAPEEMVQQLRREIRTRSPTIPVLIAVAVTAGIVFWLRRKRVKN